MNDSLDSGGAARLHITALELEVRVHTERALVRVRVHPGIDPGHLLVAEVAVLGLVALLANIIQVTASLWTILLARVDSTS